MLNGTGRMPYMLSILALLFVYSLFFPSIALASGEKVRLSFGISSLHLSDASQKDTKAALEIWLLRLGKKKGYVVEPEVRFYLTLDEIDSGIARGEINCIGMTLIEFLSLKSRNMIIPLLSYYKNNSAYETFLLLVHKDSPFKSMKDLKDKRIIIEQGKKALVPLYWLDTALLEENLPTHGKFFTMAKTEDNSSRAAIPLYFKQIDACVISRSSYKTITELNPQLGKNLRIIKESPPIVLNLVGVAKTVAQKEREDFADMGTKLSTDEDGKQILMLFQLDGLIPFKEEHLKSAEELKNRHDSLLRKAMKGK
jgi:ABC-type phosphate/phosphonate transport system substrate-binding protein